jgi:multidrug efflux system membrane fusion protein
MKTEITIGTALIALLAVGCANVNDVVERPTPVEVQPVQAFGGKDVKRFSAVLQPYDQVDLSFRVGGYVDRVAQAKGIERRMRPIQDGDHVARGTVLAQLHSVDYDARVGQAKASVAEAETQLAKAEIDNKRSSNLFASQSLTKPEYDAAKANFEASQARLESARGKLREATTSFNDTVLRAPFSATVLKRNVTQGSLASPGSPAFVLADTTVMKAVFGVPDKLIPKMKMGSPLSLYAEAFSATELRGKVSRVSASADPKSRIFEIEVSIPNPKDELKVGMITTLVIEEAVPEIGSPVVPIGALVASTKRPGQYAVFVTTAERDRTKARLVEVELGKTLGNLIVIKSGPKLGDQIITSGSGLLRDGEAVEILDRGMPVAQK